MERARLHLLTALLTLLCLPGLAHAAAPPCQARTSAPCVHLDFDPLPPDLPPLFATTAHTWLVADPSGTDYH